MKLDKIYPILLELENTSSTTKKLEILKSHQNDESLKSFFHHSLDNQVMFNITSKLSYEKAGSKSEINEIDLDKLVKREVTGNNAKVFLETIAESLTKESQEVFIRLINKDPKCGVSEGIVNKVWKGLVSSFKIMKGDSIDNMDPILSIGKQADAKIDGHRCLVYKTGSDVRFLSSNGKPMYNMEDAIDEIRNVPIDCFILDGEHFDKDWNLSSSLSSSSKTKKSSETWKYLVWDILTPDQYNGKDKTPYSERMKLLDSFFEKGILGKRVNRVKTYGIIDSINQFNELCEQSISEGYEGLMLKNPNYVWEHKRSKEWIKYKPTQTFDYKIIDVLPGDPGKKYENSLGRFLLEAKDGTQFYCGNGFSDEQRDEFLKIRGKLLNSFCEVREDRVVDKSKMVTRFPRFIKLRPDKNDW